jgi:alpha-L-fucosidase 2
MKTRNKILRRLAALPASLLLIAHAQTASAASKTYEVWEPQEAPNYGDIGGMIVMRGSNYDEHWERWSYPLGNGHMGANVFGRTVTERVQITHKDFHNDGVYKFGGLTSFAELYIDFDHSEVGNYRRSLNLNDAIKHVTYEHEGVTYTREYFMNHPDNVLVIRLTADEPGALSFNLRPEVDHLGRMHYANDGRTGSAQVAGNSATLRAHHDFFNVTLEGQVKVLNEGGSLTSKMIDPLSPSIHVEGADAATIILAAASNYILKPSVFMSPPEEKLAGNPDPHEAVSARLAAATAQGYTGLKANHLADYHHLFNRVTLDLDTKPSKLPTRLLVDAYKHGNKDPYLEELMFHFARYLLISSSREDSLPANLQGTWNQYIYAPWSGGYWHNINVQMNYWGAMSANLAETFEAYISYYKAYRPQAETYATEYVQEFSPDRVSDEPGGNGWIIGSGANPYYIPAAGRIHSGPGTGGLVAKLIMDYYRFTQDKEYLREVGYPAMLGISRFYSKALQPQEDGTLLVYPSASPEIRVQSEAQRELMKQYPWAKEAPRGYYITKGTTFDQAAVWESYKDALEGAEALGIEDEPFLDTMRREIQQLDPILVGDSGQIKEFREETTYATFGLPDHRHLSQLCGLYPGTLINSDHPEWQAAASKTLDLRGIETRNWAIAHHMNARARLGEADKALEAYQKIIADRTFPNLLTWQPPFQVDGTFGALAGVVEMLLQSHEDVVELLPALPDDWDEGSYTGLVARGNFVVDIKWKGGKARSAAVTARSGGICKLAYPGIESAHIVDSDGNRIRFTNRSDDFIAFETNPGERYRIRF